jgi:HPt (histidine-containing phosphotransfer) domain-containing protein
VIDVFSAKRKTNAPSVRIERGLDHEVIHPKNLLKIKAVVMSEGPTRLDETAVRRAEQALKALSVNFNGWMEGACRALVDARDAVRKLGGGEGRADTLHRTAHDIRGQATMLGFPLASRVGASLCLLLEHVPAALSQSEALRTVVDQHVDAINAITREGVTKEKEPIGELLTRELEAITQRLVTDFNGQTVH